MRATAWTWLVIAATSIAAFVVMRVAFNIPFLITAASVVVLSLIGSMLLSTSTPRTKASSKDTTTRPRAEPFLLSEADLLAGKGVSGFSLTPGQSIGGGRFARIGLEPDESVEVGVSGGHGGSFLRASLGYIVLTDRRLLFAGEKPLFDALAFFPFRANLRQVSLPYDAILTVQLQRRFNLGMQLACLRPAIVVRAAGSKHVFWANVFDLEAFAARIRERSLSVQ